MELLELVLSAFSYDDLKRLCVEISWNPEDIEGNTRPAFARNLLIACQQKQRLSDLIARCRHYRPALPWPDPSDFILIANELPILFDDVKKEKYFAWVQEQYNTMRVLSMSQPVPLDSIYTDVYLLSNREYIQSQTNNSAEIKFLKRQVHSKYSDRISGAELVQKHQHIFIVGQPGAGKTTFLRWLALRSAQNKSPENKIPVVVELRRFNSFEGDLLALIGWQFYLSGVVAESIAISAAEQLLGAGKMLILLDGLDEVVEEKRETLNEQIEELVQQSKDCQIIISCRPHAETRRFTKFQYVEMADFTQEQVETYIKNWFQNKQATNLIKELKQEQNKPIRELTQTPLLLALLCISFAQTNQFPQKRDDLYTNALNVVLTQWDETRGVKRDSLYGELSVERKIALLSYIAFHTFEAQQFFIKQDTLEKLIQEFWHQWRKEEIEQQKKEYGQIVVEELPTKRIDAHLILKEIVSQHGLLIEQATQTFSFSHLTLQEYFTARYVVENEASETLPQLMQYINDDLWREIFLFTAEMLPNAERVCELFVKGLNDMVIGDATIVELLKWSIAQSATSESGINPVSGRALGIFLVSDHSLNHALTRDLALASSYAHARDYARSLTISKDNSLVFSFDNTRDLLIALAITSDHAGDSHRDLALTGALPNALDYIVSLNFAFALRFDLRVLKLNDNDTQSMIDNLKKWSVTAEIPQWVKTDLQNLPSVDDYNAFKSAVEALLLKLWELASFFKLTNEQANLLADYLQATKLLVDCLQVATVDREAVEARLLLPPDGA